MSSTDVHVSLVIATQEFNEAIQRLQMTIAEKLRPPIEALAVVLRRWYNDQPGMPYTAPSLWDGEQMAGAR